MALILKILGTAAYPLSQAGLAAAWDSIPAEDDGNSYTICVPKGQEMFLQTKYTFKGKIGGPNRRFRFTAVTGDGFMENPNILNTAYRYNPSNGSYIRSNSGYEDAIFVEQDWMTVDNLQIYHDGYGDAGQAIASHPGSPNVVLENLIIKTKMEGFYTAGVGQGNGIARNILIELAGNTNSGMRFGGVSTARAENITIVRYGDRPAVGCGFYSEVDGVTVVNSASFNSGNFAAGPSAGRLQGSNNASDKVIGFGANNKAELIFADQFKGVTSANPDFRTVAADPVNNIVGSALIDAGIKTATAQSKAPNGPRQQGTATDIGAWEFPSPIQSPSAKITSIQVSKNAVTISGTTQGQPNKGAITLTKNTATVGNSAESKAATAVTITDDAFSVTITDLKWGAYDISGTIANDSFSDVIAGGTAGLFVNVEGPKVVTVTQAPMDGQVYRVYGTFTGGATSGQLYLPANKTSPEGAVDRVIPLVLNVAANTFDTPADYFLPAGIYDAGILTFSNQYGTSLPQGGTRPVTVNGISGNPITPPYTGTPVVTTVTAVVVSLATVDGVTKVTAEVQGANAPPQGVDWLPEKGSVDANGVVTKPAQTNAVQTYKIVGRSKFDPTVTGFVTVTVPALVVVTPDPEPDPDPVPVKKVLSVVVTPDTVVDEDGADVQFAVVVTVENGAPQTVNWSTDKGQIVAGKLTKPARTNVIQTVTVTAVSTFDSTKKDTATVIIPALVIVVPDPDPVDPTPVPETIKGTKIEFFFITPQGVPLANADFEVQLKTADFNDVLPGVMMPRLIEAKTDANGKKIIGLVPCDTPYYAIMNDPVSEASLAYIFYVPEVEDPNTIVRLQDIAVDVIQPKISYDIATLRLIIDAKVAALEAMRQAKQAAQEAIAKIAALALPNGAALIGYGTGTVKDALDAGTGGGGGSSGGGTGEGNTPEVNITAAEDGTLTLNKATGGFNYRTKLVGNVKLLNPVGFSAGDRIRVIVQQDDIGSRTMAYDKQYALPNAQIPALSTTPLALDKLEIDVSMSSNELLEYLVTPRILSYGTVLPLVRIGDVFYYKLAGADGLGAFSHILPGDKVYFVRDGKGPETTGSIVGPNRTSASTYLVAGMPVNGKRPLLELLPDTRPSFNKAVLNFESGMTVEVRDLRIAGARNNENDARGIAMSDSGNEADPNTMHLKIKNVEITNCNNGILTGNQSLKGSLTLEHVLIDKCGVGGPDAANSHGTGSSNGYVHNIYVGHTEAVFSALRTSFTNSLSGHNIKSRSASTTLKQVLARAAMTGRELNVPNGGLLLAENSHFWKPDGAEQNNLVGIGEEGIDTSRPREYVFRNVRFQNDRSGEGRDVTHIINFDPNVPMRFIDCEFIGELANRVNTTPSGGTFDGMVTKNGIRYYPAVPPIFELTGGPIGPLLQVGYTELAMSPTE